MTIQVDAVYSDGVLRPTQPVALPDGTEVTVAISPRGATTDPLAGVLGVGDGPAGGDVAERHDDYLYGEQ